MRVTEATYLTGRGLVTALGPDLATNWSALVAGRSAVTSISRFDPQPLGSDVAAEVSPEIEDDLRRRLDMPDEPRALLLAVAAAAAALRDVTTNASTRIGLILSTTKGDIETFENHLLSHNPAAALDTLPSQLAQRLADRLGIDGAVLVVSNACASGLVAIIHGAAMVERGDAEAVVVVGVDTLSRFVLEGFSSLGALSPGPCCPYDADREGLSLGEGAAAVVLEKEATRSFGRLVGAAVTNDASHITAPVRSGVGLRRAIENALLNAGVSPEEIASINGHGTGTIYNDAMEARALEAVFGRRMPPVYSLKGAIGHTLGAAGVVEAVIALEAARERTAPGTIGLSNLDNQARLNASSLTRPTGPGPVLSIKSGFGGVNAAAVFVGGGGE